MRWMRSAVCTALIPMAGIMACAPQPAFAQKSATLATDINGFRLGMTVQAARSLAPLKFIGGDQFEAETGGFSYNFGVTPKGRIYRVQSTQKLNHFAEDRQFVATLGRRLTTKYGEPTSHEGDSFFWELIEPVTNNSGQTLPFRTMWMNASVGGIGSDKTLEITIIDFRILWADQAVVNRKPREKAESAIQF